MNGLKASSKGIPPMPLSIVRISVSGPGSFSATQEFAIHSVRKIPFIFKDIYKLQAFYTFFNESMYILNIGFRMGSNITSGT